MERLWAGRIPDGCSSINRSLVNGFLLARLCLTHRYITGDRCVPKMLAQWELIATSNTDLTDG